MKGYGKADTMKSSYNSTVLEDENLFDLRRKDTTSDPTDEDIFFAKQRYNLHQSTPDEGVEINILKNYFSKKYGF